MDPNRNPPLLHDGGGDGDDAEGESIRTLESTIEELIKLLDDDPNDASNNNIARARRLLQFIKEDQSIAQADQDLLQLTHAANMAQGIIQQIHIDDVNAAATMQACRVIAAKLISKCSKLMSQSSGRALIPTFLGKDCAQVNNHNDYVEICNNIVHSITRFFAYNATDEQKYTIVGRLWEILCYYNIPQLLNLAASPMAARIMKNLDDAHFSKVFETTEDHDDDASMEESIGLLFLQLMLHGGSMDISSFLGKINRLPTERATESTNATACIMWSIIGFYMAWQGGEKEPITAFTKAAFLDPNNRCMKYLRLISFVQMGGICLPSIVSSLSQNSPDDVNIEAYARAISYRLEFEANKKTTNEGGVLVTLAELKQTCSKIFRHGLTIPATTIQFVHETLHGMTMDNDDAVFGYGLSRHSFKDPFKDISRCNNTYLELYYDWSRLNKSRVDMEQTIYEGYGNASSGFVKLSFQILRLRLIEKEGNTNNKNASMEQKTKSKTTTTTITGIVKNVDEQAKLKNIYNTLETALTDGQDVLYLLDTVKLLISVENGIL